MSILKQLKDLFGNLAQHDEKENLLTVLSRDFPDFSRDKLEKTLGVSGLYGKLAFSDLDITDDEISLIKTKISNRYQLDSNQLSVLIERLKKYYQNEVDTQDQYFFNLVNRHYDEDQKYQVLLELFDIAYADSEYSPEEEATLRDICKGLYLGHKDFVAAKAENLKSRD